MNRRRFIQTSSLLLPLPLLEAASFGKAQKPPKRFLVVGNPFGMHPGNFFPKRTGKQYTISTELSSLAWLKDRMTVFAHTDHGMVNGHGMQSTFLNGIHPRDAHRFPNGNVSLDQRLAESTRGLCRHACINTAVRGSNSFIWSRNGAPRPVLSDPADVYRLLFEQPANEKLAEKRKRLDRNKGILDVSRGQYDAVKRNIGKEDLKRIEQYETSVRELERKYRFQEKWLEVPKPKFSEVPEAPPVTMQSAYELLFDMILLAFQADQTRVATVEFTSGFRTSDINETKGGYHGLTHNGRRGDMLKALVAVEKFQIDQLSRCLKKMDAIKEPHGPGSLLDNTIVLFGSGMGYGGTHSNRNLPILVAGGGFKHDQGMMDLKKPNGQNTPLCNVFVALQQQFGIEDDRFNVSTGKVDF